MATDSAGFADKAISAYMRMTESGRISLVCGITREQNRNNNISWHGYGLADIYDAQDDLLISIAVGKPLRTELLQRIPAGRVYLIARIAEISGTPLEHGTYIQIQEACELAGSNGKLVDWWTL